MTQKQKLVEQFLKNPCTLKFKQIILVLVHYSFVVIPAKGSHIKIKHHKLSTDLIIPVHNGDCKDFYKKEALRRVVEIQNL